MVAMMEKPYRFRIQESYTPENIPMGRLAEYMAAYARLLGEPEAVHFEKIIDASVGLLARIDVPARAKVAQRMDNLRAGIAQKELLRAFNELDTMLRNDNATGTLEDGEGAIIVPFPGKTRVLPPTYGPFSQEGALEGQVIRVGGKDDSVPINLRDGARVHTGLSTTREIAKRLGQHLFAETVRVTGTGRYTRHADGVWELVSFKISDFEILDDAALNDVINKLRAVQDSDLNSSPESIAELLEMRGSGDIGH
jgi:hypothetical protein